jgi:ribonuclease VapC
MVLDTSAILAILFDEPERRDLGRLIGRDEIRLVSAVTSVTVSCHVEQRKGLAGRDHLDRFFLLTGAEIVAVTEEQTDYAMEGFRRFGRGRHPAGLNIADCFAYALAKATDEPLLFKGEGFALTDIVPVRSKRNGEETA